MMDIFQNLQTTNSYKQIFSEDFNSIEKTFEKLNSFDFGAITEEAEGVFWITMDEIADYERKRNECLFFKSEDENAFYYYTVENHINSFRLCIYKTNKHKMITAAINGDLQMFIQNFNNTPKMKEFSLSTAIENDNLNIVMYLLNNYKLAKTSALWYAIRYNKVNILRKLIEQNYKLPKDWLAYCVYSDSIDVARELLVNRKVQINASMEELKSNWYKKVIYNGTKTAEFVRSILQ